MVQGQATNGYPARPLRYVCLELHAKVAGFLAEEPETQLLRDVQAQLRVSMGVIEEALQKYSPNEISISYNGGKDCLVMLIAVLACFASRFESHAPSEVALESATTNGNTAHDDEFPETLEALYIVAPDSFSEVDSFVATSSADYHLQVSRYVLPMRKGLEEFLADRPSVKAIFVGTRRTDPHGQNLKHFDPTDPSWPTVMRIHPVIDWHYTEIWAFIRHLGIPYCCLYDLGYTSLGGTKDTHPNPRLKRSDSEGNGFRPAYELESDQQERLGRDK
jgi:FAD synthetase